MTDNAAGPVRINIEPGQTSEWAIDANVFGRFAEHLGGAIYPGVFENYVLNGTFDVWNTSSDPWTAYPNVDTHEGIAAPWEPVGSAEDAVFEQRVSGVRGRDDPGALVDGVEVPDDKRPDPPEVTEPRYQRIENDSDGEAGVGQRLALPDRRTGSFDVGISVRGDCSTCVVALETTDGKVLAHNALEVTGEWDRHEISLLLDSERPERYDAPQYGECFLTIKTGGTGVLDVDWVTLIPDDAVDGMFNPETIERLREANVTSLRWPGGNYASQYRWRDGVGPVAERPVVPVANWGGLDPNYLGTNEWLRFCELVDAEPYVTVPFWSAAGPDEAAAWVEYCNGDPDETELGALRAEHGYEEPWDVTYWGVGNEVWGSWQIGRTGASEYAERYADYHAAMRAVDPGIEIDACGLDPWFTQVHDGTREDVTVPADGGDPPVWNERLFEGAESAIEGVDIHRYTEGISGHTGEDGAREAWLDANDETPLGYVEVLVNDPGSWDAMFDEVRSVAAECGVDDLRITFGEWGLRAWEVDEGWPRPSRGTMAHATFAARALQALLRNGRDVELAHWTDFSQYVRPSPRGRTGQHLGAEIFRDVAEPILATDDEWRLVETTVDDSPVRDRPATGVSIPEGQIELVDAVTVGAESGGRLQTILVNGSLSQPVDVAVEYGDEVGAVHVSLFSGTDDDPFAQGDGPDDDGHEVETVEATGDGTDPVELTLPPASVVLCSR
ncbi:hypothetical protein [Halosimplex sp. TS25]|uniref:hypothetical protein n=1 Tax=Halosimplex rarum TaxID=3396619 RepID=UPI0039ED07E2